MPQFGWPSAPAGRDPRSPRGLSLFHAVAIHGINPICRERLNYLRRLE